MVPATLPNVLTGSCHCGKAGWTLEGDPGRITACNCTLCRRYGALWAYDYEGDRIALLGATRAYSRDKVAPTLEIHFCETCAGVIGWRRLQVQEDGRRRVAVNLRLAEFDQVADLAVEHFDGLDTLEVVPGTARLVRDLWF